MSTWKWWWTTSLPFSWLVRRPLPTPWDSPSSRWAVTRKYSTSKQSSNEVSKRQAPQDTPWYFESNLRCREEVDNVLGSRNEITHEDVTKLKYTSSIFKEALRLYPPANTISRRTNEDMVINGHSVPSGTTLSVSSLSKYFTWTINEVSLIFLIFKFPAYVTGRTEAYFPHCTEFRPERFLKDPNSLDTQYEFNLTTLNFPKTIDWCFSIKGFPTIRTFPFLWAHVTASVKTLPRYVLPEIIQIVIFWIETSIYCSFL